MLVGHGAELIGLQKMNTNDIQIQPQIFEQFANTRQIIQKNNEYLIDKRNTLYSNAMNLSF